MSRAHQPTTVRTAEQVLCLFRDRVNEIVTEGRAARGTIRARFRSAIDPATGATTSTVDLGDRDDVQSLMTDVRRFLAPGSDVQYEKVYRLLDVRLTDDDLREANQTNFDVWKQVLDGHGFQRRRTAYDNFRLVTNAEVFHDDPDKEAEFRAMSPVEQNLARMDVNMLLMDALDVLHPQGCLVVRALEYALVNLDP
jgi:hypothetical protein